MPTNWNAHIDAFLPEDGFEGTLVGRVWRPDVGGPSVVSVRESGVVDITNAAPTMSAFINAKIRAPWPAPTAKTLATGAQSPRTASPANKTTRSPGFCRQATCRRTRHVA